MLPKLVDYSKTPEITDIILQCLQSNEWKTMTPAEINDGNCDLFADLVVSCSSGNAEIRESDWNSILPGHIWVYCNGRHYDAECPEGVTDWVDLPIFKRYTSCQI